MSNIYILNARIIPNSFNCEYLDCKISSEIFYTLEDAIEYGKSEFVNMYYNNYYDSIEEPSISDLEDFINEKSIQYFFEIRIVSGDRKKFDTCADLMDYYNKCIKDISNEDLFNFLLTLVDSYDISYDFKGNTISEEIIPQKFLEDDMVDYQFDFSPESCSKGLVYKFYYLNNSKNNIYIIKDFDCRTDIRMDYLLTNRPIYYSEKEALKTIQSALNKIQEDYNKRTDSSYGRDEFFALFKPIIEILVINTNHRSIKTKEEYERYLEEVQTIPKEELKDYLLSYTDNCILYYDHNLNLKDTYCKIENGLNSELNYLPFNYSYKALFPDLYHVEKFDKGDAVFYKGRIWEISEKCDESIFESKDPLNHLYGYKLVDNSNNCPGFNGYLPVDEDLTPVTRITL